LYPPLPGRGQKGGYVTKVPIADIFTDRVLPSDANIDDLVKQIRESGKVEPILVRENGTLIDGLRRIKAAEQLGWKQIDAVVSDDIRLVLALIAKSHVGVKTSVRRMYEFNLVLTELNTLRLRRFKASGQWPMEQRAPEDRDFLYNQEVYLAFGLPYRSAWGRAIRLYRLALQGNEWARGLLKEVEVGDRTVDSAANVMEEKGALGGYVLDPTEQEQLLKFGFRKIRVTIEGLKKVGTPVQFPPEQFESYLEEIDRLRRSLLLIHRALRKEMRKNEQ
jgi:ParB-like nuclease domain